MRQAIGAILASATVSVMPQVSHRENGVTGTTMAV
jgi:hypothetical protein